MMSAQKVAYTKPKKTISFYSILSHSAGIQAIACYRRGSGDSNNCIEKLFSSYLKVVKNAKITPNFKHIFLNNWIRNTVRFLPVTATYTCNCLNIKAGLLTVILYVESFACRNFAPILPPTFVGETLVWLHTYSDFTTIYTYSVEYFCNTKGQHGLIYCIAENYNQGRKYSRIPQF